MAPLHQVFSLVDPRTERPFFVGTAQNPQAWLEQRMERPPESFQHGYRQVRDIARSGLSTEVRPHSMHLPRKAAQQAARRVTAALGVRCPWTEEKREWRTAVKSVHRNARAMNILLDK